MTTVTDDQLAAWGRMCEETIHCQHDSRAFYDEALGQVARIAMPVLLAEVRRQREEIARLRFERDVLARMNTRYAIAEHVTLGDDSYTEEFNWIDYETGAHGQRQGGPMAALDDLRQHIAREEGRAHE
jgi:hypothetical protein